MSSSNCYFLTCIQISQEGGQVVWYSHQLKNFQQFVVIHTVKRFGIINITEVDVFLEHSCFFDDPMDVGNLVSGSPAFRRRQWHPTPVLLPGKSHGRKSLVGCSPWGHEESDTTERLHFHFSLSCIGEGNGNPLRCSCLENPGDGGAWWAAIYGLAQRQTRLKWLSSSSPLLFFFFFPFYNWFILFFF